VVDAARTLGWRRAIRRRGPRAGRAVRHAARRCWRRSPAASRRCRRDGDRAPAP
jgi:hypothetical protein